MKKLITIILILAILPAAALSEESAASPVGMWSFYWDARELNESLGSKNRMSFDIQCYNLYIFDDGSAYMTSGNIRDGKTDFSMGALSGIWIGDANEMTIRVGNQTYKAWINESDRLFLKMTDSMAFIFTRISSYDYKEGTIK